jgi:diguanylate cyclase
VSLNYAGAPAGGVAVRFLTVAQALDQADQQMYRVKRARAAARAGKSAWVFE